MWGRSRYKAGFRLHKRKSDPPGCPTFNDFVSALVSSTGNLGPMRSSGADLLLLRVGHGGHWATVGTGPRWVIPLGWGATW